MSSIPVVRVFANGQKLARAAADFIVETGIQAVESRGGFSVALSGGGTPEPVYRLLAGDDYRDRIDWKSTQVFWGDERCVPPDDLGSNYGQAKSVLLDYVAIPTAQIWRIKGELAPEEAAADYREQLAGLGSAERPWPVLDLALMGLGADGHTASLFPGAPNPDEERLAAIPVTANYAGRPAKRVSLTPPVFNSARNVLFLVSGANKAPAVAAVLDPDADSDQLPAARIMPEKGTLLYFVDELAASRLNERSLPERP